MIRRTTMLFPALLLVAAACSGTESSLLGSDVTDPTALTSRFIAPAAVTLSPDKATMEVGKSVKLSGTVLNKEGHTVARVNTAVMRWASSDTTIAKVSGSGVVVALKPGSVMITALAGTASASSTIAVHAPGQPVPTSGVSTAAPSLPSGDSAGSGSVSTPAPISTTPTQTSTAPTAQAPTAPAPTTPTTPVTSPTTQSSSEPLPRSGDLMLVDSRRSIQTGTSLATGWPAAKLGTAPLGTQAMYEVMNGHPFNFTTNMDGQGTHALRIDWTGYNGTCADQAATLLTYLPKPYSKHIMFSWKVLLGRTATGGGVGTVGSFAVANPNCGNAARKMFLVLRDQPDMGGYDRIDYIWPGPSPVGVQFSNNDRSIGYSSRAFLPEQHVGQVITNTIELQAESAPGAKDGIMRLWINGQLVIDATNAAIGSEAFERFQLPATFNSPLHDQSEYLWDLVAWVPQG